MSLSFTRPITLLLLLLTCTACSTVIEGRSQQISITTSPEGANCVVKSNDDVLGIVPVTPGVVTIGKSKNDILVECTKPGYFPGKKKNIADLAISGIANMALLQLGIVGSLADSASGAAHKYSSEVLVELERDPNYGQNMVAQAAPQPAPMQPTYAPVQQLAQVYFVQIPTVPGQPAIMQPTGQMALMPALPGQEAALKAPYDVTQ